MPGFFTDGELASDPGSIFDYDVTAGEAFGSGFGRQFDTNPLALVARQARYLNDDLQNIAGGGVDWVDAEKAAGEVQSRGLDLKIPKGGIARHELDMLQYLKQREIEQNTTSARTRGVGPTAAGFAGGLAASLTDPINVASGFIPIVNQVRYAQWLARAGEGVFARAAVRAGAGAIEGAVGAAIIEPIVYAGATSEQLDYGLMDSFLNVTLGGVLGGGLHVIGGAVYDWGSMPASDAVARQAVATAPEHVKRDAMQAAVEALERGETVDIEHVFDAWHGSPHEFDKFDLSRMGTGEGAQAFGVGHYVAQSKGVGTYYRDFTTSEGSEGNLYQVRVKVRPDELIDWEKGVDDQPAAARKLFEERGIDMQSEMHEFVRSPEGSQALAEAGVRGVWYLDSESRGNDTKVSDARGDIAELERRLEAVRAGSTEYKAENLTAAIAERERIIAENLPKADGTRNFVIFRDGDLEIVSRNGQPIAGRTGPRGLSDLIPEARADRTQEAFNRQFVDKADETLAAEKARPKDKIESVKQDEAEFRDMVEEYRGQGRLTTETVKVDGREVLSDVDRLKQADELAAWAERRAKAFEAAAGCIEAA